MHRLIASWIFRWVFTLACAFAFFFSYGMVELVNLRIGQCV